MRYVFLILMVIAGLTLHAQQKFLAYRIKGQAMLIDKQKKTAVKVGKILNSTMTLQVSAGGSVILVCEQTSKSLVLQQGTHALNRLVGTCGERSEALTNRYFEFVWWQLTHPKASVEDERKKYMDGPGAVSRGCPDIEFITPDSLNYFRQNIVLKWKVLNPKNKVAFALYQFGQGSLPLKVIKVKDNMMAMDSIRQYMTPGTNYYWNVLVNGNEICDRRLIQYWDNESWGSFQKEMDNAVIADLDPAEAAYMKGFFLERKRFLGEAAEQYRLARTLNNGEERYQRTWKRFNKVFEFGRN